MKITRIIVFLLLILTFLFVSYLYIDITGRAVYEENARIERVVDGDTIIVTLNNEKTEKVRLLGINTPEKDMPFYENAKNFLKNLENKSIQLIRLKEDRDRYGRLLRYVFYNGIFINEEILRQGLGNFYSYSKDRYSTRLKRAEKNAREDNIGIWQKSQDSCRNCITLIELDNGKGKDDCQAGSEKIVFKNICKFNCNLDGWLIKDEATHIYRFKNFLLKSEKELTIYNGNGKDNETSLFWQNKGCASIWNDDGDSLFVWDKTGNLVLYHHY